MSQCIINPSKMCFCLTLIHYGKPIISVVSIGWLCIYATNLHMFCPTRCSKLAQRNIINQS